MKSMKKWRILLMGAVILGGCDQPAGSPGSGGGGTEEPVTHQVLFLANYEGAVPAEYGSAAVADGEAAVRPGDPARGGVRVFGLVYGAPRVRAV